MSKLLTAIVPDNKGREVTYAKLHAPLFIPGAGNYKETLTSGNEGPDRNLKMFFDGQNLLLETKGVSVIIPLPNVTHMVLKK